MKLANASVKWLILLFHIWEVPGSNFSTAIFCDIHQSLRTKLRIFNTNVKSVLLYGRETWRLIKTIIHQLQVLVNRRMRRILNIFWPVQISNQELWTRAKQKPIELEIRQRKWGWPGHTLGWPPGDIAKAALRWNPQGTGSRGPETPNNMAWNNPWRDQTSRQNRNEVKALARNRVRWQNFVRALCSLEEWWEIIIISPFRQILG